MMHFIQQITLQYQGFILISFAVSVAAALLNYKICKRFVSLITGCQLGRIRMIGLITICLSLVFIFQMRGIIMSFAILFTLRGVWMIDYVFEILNEIENPC